MKPYICPKCKSHKKEFVKYPTAYNCIGYKCTSCHYIVKTEEDD